MSERPRAEVGVCLLDESGVILDFDPDFAELVGIEADARGRSLAAVSSCALELPSAERDRTRSVLRRADADVELLCRRSTLGPIAYTLSARRVVVESALAQQLRVARQTLDSVINASPLAIVTLDEHKRVVMWNPAAERIFGWTPEEILGRPYPIVPAGELEQFERLFERVVLQGEGYTGVEATRHRKDGSAIEVNMHTAALRDAEGRVSGGMALLEDLTEKRELQQRSRHSQKMEALGRLAGGIAHDFNNLLTVVLGTADLMLLDPELTETSRGRVGEIVRVGESARELVAQLMTFSRRQVTRPEDVEINERMQTDARMLERLLGETIVLQLELAATPAFVRIDPSQLDQILVNLAVNARDAMPRGGALRIRTRVEALPDRPRRVCLEVEDDGVGIADDVLPHIFDPFFTTKADRRDGPGAGLGLANVDAIVRDAGGEVVVESEVGVGTRFRVLLPLIEVPRIRARSGPLSAAVMRGSERILLVEDNPAVRNSTAKLLTALGYEVETACDGGDVLARLDRLCVDMVLTDIAMPRVGGAELAERLRDRSPELPIVFMSGNLDVEELREEVERGRARFLQKPVSLRELARVTREVLDAALASRASAQG